MKCVQIRSFFWSVFSHIRTEYGKIRTIKNSIFGHFSRSISATPSLPRTTIRQQYRNNIPSENPEEYYRKEIAIPLLDRLTQEMKFKLTKFSNRVSTLLCFIPSIIGSLNINLNFHNVVSEYKEDLTNFQIVDQGIYL